MYICPNCNKKTETEAKFCEECGTRLVDYVAPAEPPVVEAPPVVEVQPVVEAQPVAETTPPQPAPQPQYQYVDPQHQVQYANQTPPPASKPSIGKAIAGLILGAMGLEISSVGFLYLLEYMIEDPETAIAFAIVLSIFSFPPSLVGLILSKKSANAGGVSKLSSIGKVLGLIGVILTGVLLFFGLLSSM